MNHYTKGISQYQENVVLHWVSMNEVESIIGKKFESVMEKNQFVHVVHEMLVRLN